MLVGKQTSCSFRFKSLITVLLFAPLASCLNQLPINQINKFGMRLEDASESPEVKPYGVGVDFSANSMYESHLKVLADWIM
jgi:hypothetical protein